MKTLVNIAAPFEQRSILLTSGMNPSDTWFKNIKGNHRFSKNGWLSHLRHLI